MQIQKADGTTFSVAINLLTLDDQQFVKDWILLQPEKSDFELDVKIAKEFGGLKRETYSSTDLETRDLNYNITVTNKSRETMETPIVEYAVVYDDRVRIYQSDGDWTYTTPSLSESRGISGKVSLADLVYNRDQQLKTEPVKIEKVMGDGNVTYGEDDPLGVLVKVSTASGVMVGLYRSGESGVSRFTWEDALEAAGDVSAKRDDEDSMKETTQSLSKNVGVPGPLPVKGRTIDLAATVAPSENRDGAIIVLGGKANGLALYVEEGKIHLLQVVGNETKSVTAPLPIGKFLVKASLTDSLLSLKVGDKNSITGPSHGLFGADMNAGINIGEDIGDPARKVGTYEGSFPFAGTIEDASIRFGEVED